MKLIELVSYGLIFAIGLWRLHARLTGRLHEHDHGDHGHDHHDHGHDHATMITPITTTITATIISTVTPKRRVGGASRLDSGLGLLTAAGVAPCAGAVVMVLVSAAIGVLWAEALGVVAIAVGMALTLAAIGIGSMLAHRLLVGERTSNAVGRITTLLAALRWLVPAASCCSARSCACLATERRRVGATLA